jgi:hypothetical protein
LLLRAELLPCVRFVDVGGDEGVAALDVVAEVGEGAFVEEEEVVDGLGGFAFEASEQEGEFGDLDGLGVEVYAEDVAGEEAFAFADGEDKLAARAGAEGGVFAFGPFGGVVGKVPVLVPVEEVLVGAQEEGAGAAGGVEDA